MQIPICEVCKCECGHSLLGGEITDISGFTRKGLTPDRWVCSECAYEISVEYVKKSHYSCND